MKESARTEIGPSAAKESAEASEAFFAEQREADKHGPVRFRTGCRSEEERVASLGRRRVSDFRLGGRERRAPR